MDFLKSMEISAAGLACERSRLDIASANLANAHSTRTAEGGAYRKRTPVIEAVPIPFDTILDQQALGGMQLHSVRIADVSKSKGQLEKEYNPSHPDADANGYVEQPDVTVVEEMVNMMQACRAYEANVTAMNTAKGLLLRTFEIGSA